MWKFATVRESEHEIKVHTSALAGKKAKFDMREFITAVRILRYSRY